MGVMGLQISVNDLQRKTGMTMKSNSKYIFNLFGSFSQTWMFCANVGNYNGCVC